MKELLDFIQLKGEEQEQIDAAGELIEFLYFEYIKPIHRSLRCSDEARIANDLVRLKRGLRKGTLRNISFRSTLVKELLEEYGIQESLTEPQKAIIQNSILNEYRYYITAMLIAEVVNKENRKENARQVFTVFSTVAAIIVSLVSALLGWNWFAQQLQSILQP